VETRLAQQIVAGEVRDGARVHVDTGPAGLAFTTVGPEAPAAAVGA